MKDRIIEILKERGEVNLTHFFHLIPETKGEYEMYLPVIAGVNPNILLISGVSQEFITAYNQLVIEQKIVEWNPVDIHNYFFDGSPIYEMPIAKKRHAKTQTRVWLPTSLKLIN